MFHQLVNLQNPHILIRNELYSFLYHLTLAFLFFPSALDMAPGLPSPPPPSDLAVSMPELEEETPIRRRSASMPASLPTLREEEEEEEEEEGHRLALFKA